jgi:hypothetical protein
MYILEKLEKKLGMIIFVPLKELGICFLKIDNKALTFWKSLG